MSKCAALAALVLFALALPGAPTNAQPTAPHVGAATPSLERGRVVVESLSGQDRVVADVSSALASDLAFAPDLAESGPVLARLRGRVRTSNDTHTLALVVRDAEGREHTRELVAPRADARRLGHLAADVALEIATGRAGAFSARLLFARRVGPGEKHVYVADWDGYSSRLVSRPGEVATLPAFGPGAVFYSIISRRGVYITKDDADGAPIVDGEGLDMGVAFCGDRMYFTSSRDGDSEIFSASLDGRDLRQLTHDPAIDVSPTCGPEGRIYFVSNRTGHPQVHSMRTDGSLVLAITDGPDHQTPTYCTDGARQLLATTRIENRSSQIAIRDLATNTEIVLTSNGEHEDPAFSPDCRAIAYASPRGIVVRSLVTGPGVARERLVIGGAAETLRWGFERAR